MASTPLLSPSTKAELLRRYPAEDTAALATAFGLTVRQVRCLASNNGAKKATTGDRRTSSDTYARQVHGVAAAAGKAGVSRAEAIAALPGLRDHGVCNTLHLLAFRGQLHRAGPRSRSRWFARPEWADEHQAKQLTASAARSSITCMPGVHIKLPTAPAHLPGAAIVPADVRRTTGPTVHGPAARPERDAEPGLFSLLGPGRYVAEAASWVTAITTPSATR